MCMQLWTIQHWAEEGDFFQVNSYFDFKLMNVASLYTYHNVPEPGLNLPDAGSILVWFAGMVSCPNQASSSLVLAHYGLFE